MRALACAVVALVMAQAPASAQPIDRHALVSRHDVVLTRVDPRAPLMLGNGELAFTADITGLQTFPEQYSPRAPLLTMAQWAWHSFPNPNNYTEADGLTPVDVPGRGAQRFPWMRDWSELQARPALVWLRENPHRFSLGRVSLILRGRGGEQARFEALSQTRQRLDLWTGALQSTFVFDGARVRVDTVVHPTRDCVFVRIQSNLVDLSRVGVEVRYPGVSRALNPDPSDWTHDDLHHTDVLSHADGQVLLRRRLDDAAYYSTISSSGSVIQQVGPHDFQVLRPPRAWPQRADHSLIVGVSFELERGEACGASDNPFASAAQHWRDYWSHGGAIDFSGSSDPRAAELERRIVLSQYLSALNGAGAIPPQEEGLFSNSWNGKFHLEVHPIHSAHFAAWGRPELLERGLAWYLADLPHAQAEARRHGVEGAWWTKMAGPEGRNSPSTINPFIMWQQPHPIYMAELVYRARPNAATLARYGELVDETAKLLATWPRWDEARGAYVLGPPIIPAQENHDPLTTTNPLYETEYFRWALRTAQHWRERRGLAREPAWDRVIAHMSPPAVRDGLYLPVDSEPEFWRVTQSGACAGHAIAPQCKNRDHASFLMAYGWIGGDRIDIETMRRTMRATEQAWDFRQLWGWDFPVLAMSAARLGDREHAVDWLFRDEKNNQWGVSGMTPRWHLNADGSTYAADAETYFPSNGALLLAAGMMAAGWDGSNGRAPGFPSAGWTVRVEGIQPLP
ncbi:MAG TPA: hypothetical protein VG841_08155 [Caulobacterales bacterium]|nr:hypothetical protein [Caulobacterales bacterium]